MQNFSIVPEIGGVDTSDASRPYGCDEQEAVVTAIFGEDLVLPSGAVLSVERRQTAQGYDHVGQHIGLLTANDDIDRHLLAGSWLQIHDPYSGFLAEATEAVLTAGKKDYFQMGGVHRNRAPAMYFRQKRQMVAKGLIAVAGLDDSIHPLLGANNIAIAEVSRWMALFAGHQTGEVTTVVVGRAIDNPFLLFGGRIVDRLQLIRKA